MEKTQSRMIPKMLVWDRPRPILQINQLSQLSDEVALGPRSHRNSQENRKRDGTGMIKSLCVLLLKFLLTHSETALPQPTPQY